MDKQSLVTRESDLDLSIMTSTIFSVLAAIKTEGGRIFVLMALDGTCNTQKIQIAESQIGTVFDDGVCKKGDIISFYVSEEDNIPHCQILQRDGKAVSPETVKSIQVLEKALDGCNFADAIATEVKKAMRVIKSSTGYSLLEYMMPKETAENPGKPF